MLLTNIIRELSVFAQIIVVSCFCTVTLANLARLYLAKCAYSMSYGEDVREVLYRCDLISTCIIQWFIVWELGWLVVELSTVNFITKNVLFKTRKRLCLTRRLGSQSSTKAIGLFDIH